MPVKILRYPRTPRWGTPFKMIFWRLAGHFPCRILIIMIFPRREQLNAALKRWPLLAEFAEKNKEAGDGYSGITGRARGNWRHVHYGCTRTGPCNCSVSVLAIDASPDNMLRFFFNTDIHHQDGWARALLDGRDWRDAGLRYTQHIDLLPFGQLSAGEEKMSTSCSPPWGR